MPSCMRARGLKKPVVIFTASPLCAYINHNVESCAYILNEANLCHHEWIDTFNMLELGFRCSRRLN